MLITVPNPDGGAPLFEGDHLDAHEALAEGTHDALGVLGGGRYRLKVRDASYGRGFRVTARWVGEVYDTVPA